MIKGLFLLILINFYSNSPIDHKIIKESLFLVRQETNLNVRIGKIYRGRFSRRTWFTQYKSSKSILIIKSKVPHGLAEVCGNKAIVYIGTDFYENADLIKHEILHLLGASHYKGFTNNVTPRVLRTIKKCLNI